MRRSRWNGQCVRVTSTLAKSVSQSKTVSSWPALAMVSPEVSAIKLCPQNSMPPRSGRGFVADTIYRGNAAAVCDRMTALKRLRRWAGDRLGHGEVFVILALAKILGGEQFLSADDLGPVFRRLFGLAQGILEIFGGNAEAAA
jgi:hypothetical protein